MAHIDTSGDGKGRSQDFDLNLAPIIDAMVVLIAFLMVSLSYLSIQMMDAGVSAPGGTVNSSVQGLSLDIEVKANDEVLVKLEKNGRAVKRISSTFTSLDADLGALLKGENSKPETALLNAQDAIQYDQIIRAMDLVRNHVPKVQLSGF